MTIEALQKLLNEVIAEGKNKPTDKVVFRNQGKEWECKEVDYILTAEQPDMLTLCWYDDHS